MTQIALTQNEFNLLIRDNLEGWDSDSDNDTYLDHGKGSDIHYSRTVTRLSDDAKLKIEFTWNGGFEGYQDWIRGGDFFIDSDKEDVYDECGELIPDEEEKVEEVEEKTEFQLLEEEHEKLSQEGVLNKIEESHAVPPKELEVFIEALCKTRSKDLTFSQTFPKASLEAYKVANKYKVSAAHLWSLFNSNGTAKGIRSKFEKYRVDYEFKYEGKASFDLGSQTILVNKSELKILKQKIKALEK